MAHRAPTIQYSFTVSEVNQLVTMLKEGTQDSYALYATAEDYVDDDGKAIGYRIEHGERVLARHDEVGDMIERLNGDPGVRPGQECRRALEFARAQLDTERQAAKEAAEAEALADA